MFFNEFDSSSKYESQMNQGEIELMVHLLSKIEFNFKKLTIISIFFFITTFRSTHEILSDSV